MDFLHRFLLLNPNLLQLLPMNKLIFLLSFFALTTCQAAATPPFMLQPKGSLKIIVNNRILAKANGKSISVVDIQKKLDLLFYRQFPQYSANPQARLQFYQMNWKAVLKEFIDKELVLADAKEAKIEVSAGDVRQDLEQHFGPNILENLEKAGLTFEEAWELIKDDITIRRMLFYRVNAKAVKSVTPKEIKAAYEVYAKEHLKEASYTYYLLSIRGSDPTTNAELANTAHQALQRGASIEEVKNELKQQNTDATYNFSETFHHTSKEVSPAYKEILDALEPKSFSHPIAQRSKANDMLVFRIFHLLDKDPGGQISFAEVEEKLKNDLTNQAIDKESLAYLAKLYKHFDAYQSALAEMVPEDFQPFRLQ